VTLNLCAGRKELRKQLAALRMEADHDKLFEWERNADFINLLQVRGILPAKEANNCRQRLARRIVGGSRRVGA